MRLATFAALVLLAGCGPGIDPLIGSYTFNLTGTDTTTSPSNRMDPVTGAGTLAITANALTSAYVLTVAQADASPCVLEGTALEKAATPTITIRADQKCTFVNAVGTTTATMSGTATLKEQATKSADLMALEVSYSYTGTTFGFNFAGTGKRTYAGTRR